MAQAAYQPIEQTKNEFAVAIRSLRSDCIPHETARQLLDYDHPGHTALDKRETRAKLHVR